MRSFRVGAVALNPVPADTQANKANILRWMERASCEGVALCLFPEGILAGYCVAEIAACSRSVDADEIHEIRATAERLKMVVSFGLLEKAPEGYYVSQIYTGPGIFEVYRKCHLTEEEKKYCKAGDRLSVQDLGFVKMGTQICYDSAFPRACETLIRRGAEVLFTPTGHSFYTDEGEPRDYKSAIEKRRRHVNKYWRARAYDFSCYSIYVDNVGETSRGEWYPGYIGIFGPDGNIVGENISCNEALVTADLDGAFLQKAREEWIGHYKSLVDARPELYD